MISSSRVQLRCPRIADVVRKNEVRDEDDRCEYTKIIGEEISPLFVTLVHIRIQIETKSS